MLRGISHHQEVCVLLLLEIGEKYPFYHHALDVC